jgi:hypothetical protein
MYSKGSMYGLMATRTAFAYLLIAIRSKLYRGKLPKEELYTKEDVRIKTED